MKTKTIKQTITFASSPEKLYELFLDSKKLTRLHGASTSMTRRAKGKFSVFGGYCHGYNMELVPGKKIEQAWYFSEEGWPEDHYSVCTFLFEASPKGAKLLFTQKGVPEHKYEDLKKGWYEYYWNPVSQYLESL